MLVPSVYNYLSEKLFEITYWKYWSILCVFGGLPKGSVSSVCLPVAEACDRSTCPWQRVGVLSRALLHLPVFSESIPLFFLSCSTHLSTYDVREEICYVPWEQSVEKELKGKKAREPGRNAVKGGELTCGDQCTGSRWKRQHKWFWMWKYWWPISWADADPLWYHWARFLAPKHLFLVIHISSLYCPSPLHLIEVSVPNKSNLCSSALRLFVFNVSSNPAWKHSTDKMNREFTEGKNEWWK